MAQPEQQAREEIDRLLIAAGWRVCDLFQANIHANRGVALREFQLDAGYGSADYLLYVDGKAAGIIEAKKQGMTLTGVEVQSGRYAQGLPASLPAWRRHAVWRSGLPGRDFGAAGSRSRLLRCRSFQPAARLELGGCGADHPGSSRLECRKSPFADPRRTCKRFPVMTHAARYSIIRFLPYAETEEFANVGVVMFAPTARYFDFRLSNKWRRLGAFFDTLDRRVFAEGVRAFQDELVRTRETAAKLVDGEPRGQVSAQRVFEDLVRPREALFRFSSIRAVMTDAPDAKLAALFDYYVEHDFATPEYHEALIERAVRGVLRREGLGERFRRAKLGTGALQFAVPFAEMDEAGHVHRVIKPMHLAYDDPVRILDHGNQWLGRLRHLERVKAMPEAMLLAVTEPPANTDRHDAFDEVRRDLETLGATFAASNDEQAVLGFARAA